jgi:tellurite resistance protein
LERQSAELPVPAGGAPVVSGRLPNTARLIHGAEESLKEHTYNPPPDAEYFQSLLELGYLVASADGLAPEERAALAKLVEHATGSVVEHAALQRHFDDLDACSEALGRRERLGRVAANFEDLSAREEAISFAALIAIADGKLARPEAEVLIELGEHFSFSQMDVKAVLGQVVAGIKLALEE